MTTAAHGALLQRGGLTERIVALLDAGETDGAAIRDMITAIVGLGAATVVLVAAWVAVERRSIELVRWSRAGSTRSRPSLGKDS